MARAGKKPTASKSRSKSKKRKTKFKPDLEVIWTGNEDLACVVKGRELVTMAERLGAEQQKLEAFQRRKKGVVAQLSADQKTIEAEVSRLARVVIDHEEIRPVECESVADYPGGVVRTRRKDTKEELRARPLSQHERQKAFGKDGKTKPAERDEKAEREAGGPPPAKSPEEKRADVFAYFDKKGKTTTTVPKGNPASSGRFDHQFVPTVASKGANGRCSCETFPPGRGRSVPFGRWAGHYAEKTGAVAPKTVAAVKPVKVKVKVEISGDTEAGQGDDKGKGAKKGARK